MPGLSCRISTLTKAKISHTLDRAEDPAETLDYAYERQLEDLQSVKKGIADVVTAEKRLQLQEEDLRQRADKLDLPSEEGPVAKNANLINAAGNSSAAACSRVGPRRRRVACPRGAPCAAQPLTVTTPRNASWHRGGVRFDG